MAWSMRRFLKATACRGKLEYEDLAKIAREQGMSLEDAKTDW